MLFIVTSTHQASGMISVLAWLVFCKQSPETALAASTQTATIGKVTTHFLDGSLQSGMHGQHHHTQTTQSCLRCHYISVQTPRRPVHSYQAVTPWRQCIYTKRWALVRCMGVRHVSNSCDAKQFENLTRGERQWPLTLLKWYLHRIQCRTAALQQHHLDWKEGVLPPKVTL